MPAPYPGPPAELPETEELEHTAAWCLRRVDAADTASARAAGLLETLTEDPYRVLWAELRAAGNWHGELDAISDCAAPATEGRRRIGLSEHLPDGADYLRGLLRIADSLI